MTAATNCLDVLIVDDEPHVRSVLARLLKDFFTGTVRIAGEAGGVADAYEMIQDLSPGLVLLDVEMHGEDGFQLLEKFTGPVGFDIIFITSYDHYAIRALRHSALDYLLKPVMLDEFKLAIEKALERQNSKESIAPQVEHLQKNARANLEEQSIVLNQKNKLETVYCRDVVWLEADVNYTIVHLRHGRKHHVAKTLKEFEDMLCGEGSRFLRIHKASIVHAPFVEKLVQVPAPALYLKTGQKLEISRRKKTEVMLALAEWGLG